MCMLSGGDFRNLSVGATCQNNDGTKATVIGFFKENHLTEQIHMEHKGLPMVLCCSTAEDGSVFSQSYFSLSPVSSGQGAIDLLDLDVAKKLFSLVWTKDQTLSQYSI